MPNTLPPMGNDVPDITVVIPCRNEEANAAAIAAAVAQQVESTGHTFDILFIDNGSTDRTVEIIKDLCKQDPRIRLIVNTRNFGQIRSPAHVLYTARGRGIIGICADFQDPPEMLPGFIELWRKGTPIVLAVREEERTGWILRIMRELSYKLARQFGDTPVIPNATGFGMFDRKVLDTIKAMNEPEPFFRSLLVETGYDIVTVPYKRPERAGGRSNNNFFSLLDFAVSGLTNSSKRLLRWPLYLGVIGCLLSLLMLIGAGLALLFGREISGWLIGAVIQAQFALLFGFLGLLGDHVRLISERTRRTPHVVERERVNFPPDY